MSRFVTDWVSDVSSAGTERRWGSGPRCRSLRVPLASLQSARQDCIIETPSEPANLRSRRDEQVVVEISRADPDWPASTLSHGSSDTGSAPASYVHSATSSGTSTGSDRSPGQVSWIRDTDSTICERPGFGTWAPARGLSPFSMPTHLPASILMKISRRPRSLVDLAAPRSSCRNSFESMVSRRAGQPVGQGCLKVADSISASRKPRSRLSILYEPVRP